MLAGERAAQIEGGPEDLGERGVDALGDGGLAVVLVGEDVDVKVAVAGVAEGRHEQSVAAADRVAAAKHLGDRARGYDDVFGDLEGVRFAQRT